jgi:BMFP domain-containing protein YqiC
MKCPQKATEMWGRFYEHTPRMPWAWTPPSSGLPFGSQDMAHDWVRMSGDLFKRYWAMPGSGVGAETVFKGVDAMQVYWSLYEFWTKWVQNMAPLSGRDVTDAQVQEAGRKLRTEYESVIKAFLGSSPPQTVQEIMRLQGEHFDRTFSVWKQFKAPWMDLQSQWPDAASKMMSGDLTGMREGAGLWQKAILDTIGKLLNLPAFGMSREHEQRARSALDAYINFQAILPIYYSTFQTASKDAFERLLRETRTLSSDTSPEGFRKFYRRWVTIHEDTFFELFRKPEFAQLMNRVVNRGLTLRQRINEMTSTYLEVWNVPTREELDDVYRTIYDQRNQLKALRRRLDELEGVTAYGREAMEA